MGKNLRRMFFFISVLVVLGATLASRGMVALSSGTTMAVEPRVSVEAPNTLFNITIVITDVTELFIWQFNLTFDPLVLEYVDYTEGPFLKEVATTWPLEPSNGTGWVAGGGGFAPPYPVEGASGDGILAYVTFKAKVEGQSDLHFTGVFPGEPAKQQTFLRTWDPVNMELVDIPFTPEDGGFQYPLLRDVAVTGVTVSSDSVVVGESVSINVTVKNNGEVSENFTVSVSYDSVSIGTPQKVENLDIGALETVHFVWDTKNVAPGNYTLTAAASVVSGETNTDDNSYSDVFVLVKEAAALPIELLIAVVVVVIVVALGVGVFLLRRRK
jgi:hypothetical protein